MKPSIGRIVEFFPAAGATLPNQATSVPGIITQVFQDHCNMNLFVPDNENPVVAAWSIPQKGSIVHQEGMAYWDWPQRVSEEPIAKLVREPDPIKHVDELPQSNGPIQS